MVRNSASSTAELPPPITTTSWPAIEEPVAGGAGRDAETLELLLRRQPQPLRLRAGGQHQRIGRIDRAAVAPCREGPLAQVELRDVVGDDLGAGGARMLLHADHQVRAEHLRVARPVLHLGGDGQLAAGLDALDQDRLQHRPRPVDRRRIAGRTRADDQKPCMTCLGHGEPLAFGALYGRHRPGCKARPGHARHASGAPAQSSRARRVLYSASLIEPAAFSLSSFSISSAALKPTAWRSCSRAFSAWAMSRSAMLAPWVTR